MENMLNKLRSTMSSAANSAVSNAVSIASQVSNYLPGNPVTREYEATEHVASAGRGLLWKIYKGYKKSTKQEAAIFVFEKRQLEKWDRQEREFMLDKLRKGVSQLTRLRHPQVLTVQHPLEESRETLAFATEPVHSSLANALGNQTNMPSPPPVYLKDFQFYDVEIKYGLLQVSEGLSFLHGSLKIVHCCICPENIVLNYQGIWKLFGFDFCVSNTSTADEPPFWPFEEYDSNSHELSQPPMDYMAPEYALTHKLSPATDIFSLGVVIYCIYNKGKTLFQNHNDFAIFKSHTTELKNSNRMSLNGIPNELKDQVRSMLNATAELRPDILQFLKISYFDDIGVKTLNYLDQLFQWDNMQKSQFYKTLPQIIPHLPHRVLLLRVIACLVNECVNPTMVPFVLPVILQVAEQASKEEFVQHILPRLKPIMKITEPMQVMLLLMMKMELLLSKTPAEDIRSDTLPLLYRALECDTQQIQELCLSVIPTCSPLVDQPTMKNALLPRIKKLCVSTGYLSVRINCLVCIGKVLEHLDKWLVMDDIFPFLETVPSKEAPVVMATVGILKMALYHKKLGISKEILATKVLPFLFPLSIENSLTPDQHSSVMALIKDMIERVETEQKAKLEHLNSIRKEQKALEMVMPTANGSDLKSTSTPNLDFNFDIFETYQKSEKAVLPTSASVPSNSFTEEKHRLASQQNLRSTNSQSTFTPLLPSPPQPHNPVEQRRNNDATSQLISSNLNNLRVSKPAEANPMLPTISLQGFIPVGAATAGGSWVSQPTQYSAVPNIMSLQGFIPVGSATAGGSWVSQPTQYNAVPNIMSPPQQYPNKGFSTLASPPFQKQNNTPSAKSEFRPLSSSDISDFLN